MTTKVRGYEKGAVWAWFGGKPGTWAHYVNEAGLAYLRQRGLTGEAEYPPPPSRAGLCNFWDWPCPDPVKGRFCGGLIENEAAAPYYPFWLVLTCWSNLDAPYTPPQQLKLFEPPKVWYPRIGLEHHGPRPGKVFWVAAYYCQVGARAAVLRDRKCKPPPYSVESIMVTRNKTPKGWGRKIISRPVDTCRG